MKWYDYRPFSPKWAKEYQCECTYGEITKQPEFIDWVQRCKKTTGTAYLPHIIKTFIAGELWWLNHGRPYYDLYPGIAEAFTKVDLKKIECRHLNPPFPAIMIRFAVDNELKFRAALVVCHADAEDGSTRLAIGFDDHIGPTELFSGSSIPRLHWGGFKMPTSGTTILDDTGIEGAYNSPHAFEKLLQIYTTICLIRKNPDLIEQQPLSSDLARFERATDFEERQKLLDKAQRRGKLAFAIGKHVETAAGFRHPHFAIRWMGKGDPKTPVLRPIKGCIVNRQKITNVPTGYLDDLQEGIE